MRVNNEKSKSGTMTQPRPGTISTFNVSFRDVGITYVLIDQNNKNLESNEESVWCREMTNSNVKNVPDSKVGRIKRNLSTA